MLWGHWQHPHLWHEDFPASFPGNSRPRCATAREKVVLVGKACEECNCKSAMSWDGQKLFYNKTSQLISQSTLLARERAPWDEPCCRNLTTWELCSLEPTIKLRKQHLALWWQCGRQRWETFLGAPGCANLEFTAQQQSRRPRRNNVQSKSQLQKFSPDFYMCAMAHACWSLHDTHRHTYNTHT